MSILFFCHFVGLEMEYLRGKNQHFRQIFKVYGEVVIGSIYLQNENDLPSSSFQLRSGRTSKFHEKRLKVLLKENGQP